MSRGLLDKLWRVLARPTRSGKTLDCNQSVITTRFVMLDGRDVVSVFHESDGDWQFLSRDEVREADAFVVSMAEMLEYDKSLVEIVETLPLGKQAVRADRRDSWRVLDIEGE